jgi:anti-anti-sigma factor
MARDSVAGTYSMMVDDHDGVEVARFTAKDFGNPSLLEDTFQTLVSGLGRRRLVVDLSEIENTMSLGIAVLVAAQGLALIHETRLAFAGVSPNVAKLLALTGADKVLTTFETVEAAVESMRE